MRLLRRGPCDCRRGIRTSGKALGRFPQEARREASCTSRQKLPPCTSPGSSGLEVAKNASGCSEVCMFAACPASGRSSRASGSTSLKRAHLLVSGRLRPLIRPDDSALPPRGHAAPRIRTEAGRPPLSLQPWRRLTEQLPLPLPPPPSNRASLLLLQSPAHQLLQAPLHVPRVSFLTTITRGILLALT